MHALSRALVWSPVVILAVAFLLRLRPSPLADARADEGAPPVPVLVELFTSEGCSSCPPAEDELSRLEAEHPVAGARIVPLGYHVDYWNELGWPDPYSSPAWTARQGEYDRDGRLYTPQAVVQGEHDCVGSDDGALKRLVRDAASRPSARVSVGIVPGSPTADTLRVSTRVSSLPPVSPGDRAEVWVALVEHGVVNQVPRGENAGRRLRHAPIVRERSAAGAIGADGGAVEATLSLPAGVRRDHLDLVAVVQERSGRRVLGVGVGALGAGAP